LKVSGCVSKAALRFPVNSLAGSSKSDIGTAAKPFTSNLDSAASSPNPRQEGVTLLHKCANALHDPGIERRNVFGECCMFSRQKAHEEENTGSSSVFLLFGSGSATTSIAPDL